MLRVAHLTSVHNALDHRIFRKECRTLARAGYAVTIIGPHGADGVHESVSIRAIAKPRSRALRMTQSVWRIYRAAVQVDADIYHFHDPELIPIGLLLRARGKRVIYDVHEDYPRDIQLKSYLPGYARRAIAAIVEVIEASTASRFSAIVTVTPTIAERFAAANKNTVMVRNLPFREELLDDTSKPWNSRRPAATYVGSISLERGIAEIVEAAGILPESLDATLDLAGNEVPPQITQMAGWARVRHHGILDQRSTYALLRQVRVGLACQHAVSIFLDCIPTKLFEYMGAGLPIVASNIPFWRQMIEEFQCAIFVNSFNPREIADALEYLLVNPAEAEAMGRRGQEAVASQFNWNSEAKTLVDLYTGLIGAPCAG